MNLKKINQQMPALVPFSSFIVGPFSKAYKKVVV